MAPAQPCGVGHADGANQRAQSGEHATNVISGERLGEETVDLPQEIVDIGAAGHRLVRPMSPGCVGISNQPAGLGGDDEEHTLLGARQDSGRHRDPLARNDEMNALRRLDPSR